jgi:hypothetical protein
MSARALIFMLLLASAAALAEPPASEATGTVWVTLRPQASLPLKSPSVQIAGKAATAASGAFRAEGLTAGWVVISAAAEGYQPLEQKVLVPAGGQTSVLLPLERIPGPGTVRGRVLRPEGKDGAQVPVAEVEILLAGQVIGRSDTDGRFVLPAVGPGPVTLKLAGAGVRPQEEVVVVPSHGEASLEVIMQRADEVKAWMRGRVRSTLGRPLQATLKVEEAGIKARTKARGDFEFRLPAGRYHVTFEARGHVSQTKVVDVAPGDQALFYVDLSPLEN